MNVRTRWIHLLGSNRVLRAIAGMLPQSIVDFFDFHTSDRMKFEPRLGSVFLFLIAIIPAQLLLLHSLAIVPLSWEKQELREVAPFEGFAYQCSIASKKRSGLISLGYGIGTIYENASPLVFHVDTGYGVVSRMGQGRYYISKKVVYFSSSDNSDPRKNGKKYYLVRPRPPTLVFAFTLYLLAVSAIVAFIIRYRFWLMRFVTAPPFYVPALILIILFVVNRLWFFVNFPMAGIHPDSGGYYAIAEQLSSGQSPSFSMRPAAYPIIMWLVYAISNKVMSLVLVQNFACLAGGLCLLYAIFRLSPRLSLLAALALAGFYYSATSMEHDTALLSESFYTTFLICSFAFLLLGLRDKGKPWWLVLSSTSMVLAILTRPAGIFLFITYLLIIIFIIRNKYRIISVCGFILPMLLIMSLMCTYNFNKIGTFSPDAWGEANLAVGTFTFWEQDKSYPPEINESIKRIQAVIQNRFRVTNQDGNLLYTSWDQKKLSRIFVQSFNGEALNIAMLLGGENYGTKNRAWIRKIAFDSIKKHPDVYFKFVKTMLLNYYKPASDFDFRAYLLNRAQNIYMNKAFSAQKGNDFMVRLGKEFADPDPMRNVTITDYNTSSEIALNERIILRATPLWRAYYSLLKLRRTIFGSIFWPIAFFMILLTSIVKLLFSKGTDLNAFMLFIMTISAFGASLVVSLVEYSQPRYSYPMEWVYYIAIVLAPLLFMRNNSSHVENK